MRNIRRVRRINRRSQIVRMTRNEAQKMMNERSRAMMDRCNIGSPLYFFGNMSSEEYLFTKASDPHRW